MEKRGVIAPGITPEEKDNKKNEKNAADDISRLDADFRKRAAETVVKVKPAK
jgi:hypothetical protein